MRRHTTPRGLCSPGGSHPSLPISWSFHHRPVWRAGPGLGKLEGAGGSTQVHALFAAPRPLETLAWAPTGPRQRHGGPWSDIRPQLHPEKEESHSRGCVGPVMSPGGP